MTDFFLPPTAPQPPERPHSGLGVEAQEDTPLDRISGCRERDHGGLSVGVSRGIMDRKGCRPGIQRKPAARTRLVAKASGTTRVRSEMRKGRGLARRLRKPRHKKERQVVETLRLERETARLQNRQAAIQAESRERSRFGFGGPG